MRIGLPQEIKNHEYRVGYVTYDAVARALGYNFVNADTLLG